MQTCIPDLVESKFMTWEAQILPSGWLRLLVRQANLTPTLWLPDACILMTKTQQALMAFGFVYIVHPRWLHSWAHALFGNLVGHSIVRHLLLGEEVQVWSSSHIIDCHTTLAGKLILCFEKTCGNSCYKSGIPCSWFYCFVLINNFFSNFLRKVPWKEIFWRVSKNVFTLISPLNDTLVDLRILRLKTRKVQA